MAENRPEYRDSRIPRSVKVYTIGQESRHLIINNIPSISGEEEIIQDLINKCWVYGQVKEWKLLDKDDDKKGKIEKADFTNRVYVQYSTIDQSRLAKNKLSGFVFYANLLQASYAPEYDSIDDLRLKIQNRQSLVYNRLQQLIKENRKIKNHHHHHYNNNNNNSNNKRKHSFIIEIKKEDHVQQQAQQAQQEQYLMNSELSLLNTTITSRMNHDHNYNNSATKSISQPSSSLINQKQRRRI